MAEAGERLAATDPAKACCSCRTGLRREISPLVVLARRERMGGRHDGHKPVAPDHARIEVEDSWEQAMKATSSRSSRTCTCASSAESSVISRATCAFSDGERLDERRKGNERPLARSALPIDDRSSVLNASSPHVLPPLYSAVAFASIGGARRLRPDRKLTAQSAGISRRLSFIPLYRE